MAVIKIKTGNKERPEVTVDTNSCALFTRGEYRLWPDTRRRLPQREEPEITPFDEEYASRRPREIGFFAQTQKGRMIEAITAIVPEGLRYQMIVVKKENVETLKRVILEGINKGCRVGLPTCYGEGGRFFGKTHWLMGMDNMDVFNYFFGEETDKKAPAADYEKLREKYPYFHMDEPFRYRDWLAVNEMKEIVVVSNPPGHATKHEEHFVGGAYLDNGNLIFEFTPFTYHTRSIETRGNRGILMFSVSKDDSFNIKSINISEEQAQLMKKSLKEAFLRSGSIAISPPDKETLERLCTPENLTNLFRNIVKAFLKRKPDVVRSLEQLERCGFETLDFIGKAGERNKVKYLLVFEAKGRGF